MRTFRLFLIISLIFFIAENIQSATYYLTSAGSGNAHLTASWNTDPGGAGSSPSGFSTSGDLFVINPGITGILPANLTMGVTAGNGGTISLRVDGSLAINSGVVLTLNARNSAITNLTISSNGSIIFEGTSGNQLIAEKTGNGSGLINFTLSNNALFKTANSSGIYGSGTTYSIHAENFSSNFNSNANYEFNGANQSTFGLPATVQNLIFSGSGVKTFAAASTINGILSIEGTATVSGTPGFGASSTIQYKGTGNRTIGSEFPAGFSGSGGVIIDQGDGNTVTLNANKTDLSNIFVRSGIFDLSTYTLNRNTSGGTLVVEDGAVLKIGGTNSLSSNYSISVINCTSTIEYYGSNQTVRGMNYGNLILSGTNTKTLQTGTTNICNDFTVSGSTTVAGVTGLTIGRNLLIQTGATFTAGAYTHKVAGNWTQSGTFNASNSTIEFNGGNSGNIGTSNFNHVIFSGSGSKQATGVLSVAGNLEITSNFYAGNYTHSLSGNWTDNGTFYPQTGDISFIGANAQTINGNSTTAFNKLTLNGAGGVNLTKAISVTDSLKLIEGVLSLGNHNLAVENVSNGSDNSYVQTNGSGVLRKEVTSNVAALFPVGDSAYNPITITNTTADNTDFYGVKVFDDLVSNANDSTQTIHRKWQIIEDVAGGSTLTIIASYNAGEAGSNFNAGVTPTFGFFNGTNWLAPFTATAGGGDPFTFTSDSGSFVFDDLTEATGFLSLGSGDAFQASKLFIQSMIPANPFLEQNNVTITIQSQNSQNVPANVSQQTIFSLSATNTDFSVTPIDTIDVGSYTTVLSGLSFSTVSASASVTATRTSGDLLSPHTGNTFSVVGGSIYRPKSSGDWTSVQWERSTNGGNNWTDYAVPTNSIFSESDAIIIPDGINLTANTTASFYNLKIEDGGTLDLNSSGVLTLNHSVGGEDDGFRILGTFQNSGGGFTNANEDYPILIQGGTYIHARNGGAIPVANWMSMNNNLSTCQVTGLSDEPIGRLDQNFQHYTWDNTFQSVSQVLTDNLYISGALTLTNGVITTGSEYYVVIASTGEVNSSNNARVHGNVRRYVPNIASPAIDFPVGDENYYTPVSISFSGSITGSGYVNASTTYFPAQPSASSGLSQEQYIKRRWTIENHGVSNFSSYDANFTFVDSDKAGNPTTSELVVRKLNGSIWSVTANGTRTANSTEGVGLTSFGTFAIGESSCSDTNAIWFGSFSSDWNTGANWCSGSVPTAAKNVIILSEATHQPIITATAYCKDIHIEAGAVLTFAGEHTLNVYGDWYLVGTFIPENGTVSFVGTSVQSIYGETTFSSLSINNAVGVKAYDNLTVNVALDLVSDNPSTTQGTLVMENNHILFMGPASFTYGIGDVTGYINRSSFTWERDYSFGSRWTRVYFDNVSGQTLPSSITVKVSLGSAPDWNAVDNLGDTIVNPLRRIYEIIQTGGEGTQASIKLHYRDNEYNVGLNEYNFNIWGRRKVGSDHYVTEYGQVYRDITENYVMIQNIDFVNIPNVWGEYMMTVAPAKVLVLTWKGSNGGGGSSWNTASNWIPQAVPSADYIVLIPNGATTPADPILPTGASCVSIIIKSGGILNTVNNASLTLYGNWTNEAGTGGFIAGNSTISVESTASSFTGNTDFYNIFVANDNKMTPASGSQLGISGNLTIDSTGVFDAAINVNTITYKGTITQSIVNPNGNTAGYSNLIFSNSGSKILPEILEIKGNFTNNSTGSIDVMTHLSTVKLTGSSAQSLDGTNSTTLNNLTLGGAGTKSLATAPTVNGILSIEGTATVSGSPVLGSTSTIQYKGTGARTIGDEFPSNFAGSGGLIVDQGNGNTVLLNTNKTAMAGNLYVQSGTLDLSNFTIDRVSNGDSLILDAGVVLKIGGTNTLPANYATHEIDCASTIEYAGATQVVSNLNSAQDYGNLILSGAETKTILSGVSNICNNLTVSTDTVVTNAELTVSGNVEMISGSYFNAGGILIVNDTLMTETGSVIGMNTFPLQGTLSHIINNGLIISMDSSVAPIPTGKNWLGTGIIRLQGTSPQSIVSGTFNQLSLNNPKGVSMIENAEIMVNGILTVDSGKLVIGTGSKMHATSIVNQVGVEGLIITGSSETTPNGTLIFHNEEEDPVQATVHMYSKAYYDPEGPVGYKFKWQFFGIPLRSIVADPTFYGSYIRKYEESGTTPTTLWVDLYNHSVLLPFAGYEITQTSPKTIVFQGELENRDLSLNLSYSTTEGTIYPGQHILGNPYTAAIDISKLTFAADLDASVYLYNMGSYSDWEVETTGGTDTRPGQYTVIPKQLSGRAEGLPAQIPSMQGFLIKTKAPHLATTFGIPYNTVVVQNTDKQRAPGLFKTEEPEIAYTLIDIKGISYSDRMWLFTNPACTKGFDNGWDGEKFLGSALTPQIYAVEAAGDYQVNTVDDINNTTLAFKAGVDDTYTITFTHDNSEYYYEEIYLSDELENKMINITQSGTQYSFNATPSSWMLDRFKIIAQPNLNSNVEMVDSFLDIFVSASTIYIKNQSSSNGELVIYDVMGKVTYQSAFGAMSESSFTTNLPDGVYVIKAATEKDKIVKQVIL